MVGYSYLTKDYKSLGYTRRGLLIHNKKIFLSWLWVALCSISIFLIVPLARAIQRYVYEHWGRGAFLYFVFGTLSIGLVILIYYLVYKLKIRSLPNYIWLLLISGLYTYFILKLKNIPEEAVHFLEYGLLGFFLFKALSHHIKDKSIYLTATLFALFIGIFDEFLQWLMPQRYWDFRDAGLNGLSGGLLQLLIWQVIKPKIISEKMNAKSLKIFSSIFAVLLIVLGLCVSNTPERVAVYTKQIPWLSYLQKEEPMSEFGYKFHDPEIGVFFSRLSPERLLKTDKEKGKEYVQILNSSLNMNYEKFLREYNPTSNPFLNELRVHVFRRDSYYEKAKATKKLSKKKKFYFIAYKENLILQKYFPQTIVKSIFNWSEDKITESEALIDRSKPYKSPVSVNLFTAFSERGIWITIFTLLSILVLINVIWHWKRKL